MLDPTDSVAFRVTARFSPYQGTDTPAYVEGIAGARSTDNGDAFQVRLISLIHRGNPCGPVIAGVDLEGQITCATRHTSSAGDVMRLSYSSRIGTDASPEPTNPSGINQYEVVMVELDESGQAWRLVARFDAPNTKGDSDLTRVED